MKTIHIPKLPEDKFFKIKILKGKSLLINGSFYKLILRKQSIEGVEIEKGTLLTVGVKYCNIEAFLDEAEVLGKYLNPILKFSVIQKLRNESLKSFVI